MVVLLIDFQFYDKSTPTGNLTGPADYPLQFSGQQLGLTTCSGLAALFGRHCSDSTVRCAVLNHQH